MKLTHTFSQDEIDEIQHALSVEKSIVVKERLQAIHMTMQNIKRSDIVKILGRTRFYVANWIKYYKESGLARLVENRGGANHRYLMKEQEDFIKELIIHSSPKDCDYSQVTWSGALVVDVIEKMYTKTYTKEGVYALLKRLGVSYKKANKIDPKKSQKVINEWKSQVEKNLKILT